MNLESKIFQTEFLSPKKKNRNRILTQKQFIFCVPIIHTCDLPQFSEHELEVHTTQPIINQVNEPSDICFSNFYVWYYIYQYAKYDTKFSNINYGNLSVFNFSMRIYVIIFYKHLWFNDELKCENTFGVKLCAALYIFEFVFKTFWQKLSGLFKWIIMKLLIFFVSLRNLWFSYGYEEQNIEFESAWEMSPNVFIYTLSRLADITRLFSLIYCNW